MPSFTPARLLNETLQPNKIANQIFLTRLSLNYSYPIADEINIYVKELDFFIGYIKSIGINSHKEDFAP